jgi:hypothetical protein
LGNNSQGLKKTASKPKGEKNMPLQKLKIMFTPDAALKINLAIKGSNVPPLDSQNQRVFNDVFDHGVEGDFYHVELNDGYGFSYPNRNIERISSSWERVESEDELMELEDSEENFDIEELDQIVSNFRDKIEDMFTR